MSTFLKWLSLASKIFSVAVMLDWTSIVPKYGAVIFFVASITKDIVNRIGDWIDDGKLNQSFKGAALIPFLLVGIMLSGCATPERAAYRTLGTTATLVDTTMQAWGDYVKLGLATPDDQIRARQLYGDYQAAMRVAKIVETKLKTGNNPQDPAWINVMDALSESTDALMDFVIIFCPQIKPLRK
jgi:hypothetical protein